MSIKDAEFIKQILIAIISGDISPLKVKQLHSICLVFSISSLSVKKYHFIVEEVQINMGCTLRDLACNCIDELFRTENGRLIEIERYFLKKFPDGLERIQAEIIKANLGLLVKSKTNQQLSEIREKSGDLYFKIRKAVSTEIARRTKTYVQKRINGKKIITMYNSHDNNSILPEVDKYILLEWLFDIKLKKYDVAKVLREVFTILNSQDRFAKYIEETLLLSTLKEFYIAKMINSIGEYVEYKYNIEDVEDTNKSEEWYNEKNK